MLLLLLLLIYYVRFRESFAIALESDARVRSCAGCNPKPQLRQLSNHAKAAHG
jgi:hypothetical protein